MERQGTQGSRQQIGGRFPEQTEDSSAGNRTAIRKVQNRSFSAAEENHFREKNRE